MAHRTHKGNMVCRLHFIDTTNKKIKFFMKDFFSNMTKPAVLVTFTREIHNGKLHFLGSDIYLWASLKPGDSNNNRFSS